jgi:3-oxoacyl-[acyl-carrier protein] reductase
MDLGLRDRNCLVTGASTGIGYATALALAAEGARVVAAARSLTALDGLAAAIKAVGGIAPVLLAADLAGPGAGEQLAAEALAQAGGIDVLVNNAGGSRPMTEPDDAAVWDEAFRLNFVAARRLGECLIPAMAERGWGRVVSVTGAVAGKTINAAAPAKAALESWSKGAAGTYAAQGVTVNCVAPGRLNTRQILERLHPTNASRQEFIARNIPAGRFGEAEEASSVIVFLASARAGYVNGVTIPVDGGALRYTL